MKTAIILGSILGLAHGTAAFAGPYANIEANSSFTGADYTGTSTDFHVGIEGESGVASYGIQGGPTVVSPDGAESETILTAKVFGSVAASEQLSLYGEISAAFDDVNGYGSKVGVKYSF